MAKEKKHLDKVKEQFESADDYDVKMGRVCPSHQPLLDAIVRTATHLVKPGRILELGVGTGLLAQDLLQAFPQARLTAMDFSPNMLERAGKRLSRFSKRLELVEGDFYEVPLPPAQDLVVSAYAIHHLSDIQKAQLFEKIYASLVDDGVFVNGDCVIATSERLDRLQEMCWLDAMHEQEATKDEIEQMISDYEEYDIPATVDDQLGWLDRAGFEEVECVWRNFGSAMIVAIK